MAIASILVVDDEQDVRELLQGVLEAADYEVTTAIDGEQAIRLLALQKFSLVLTDLLMPNKDGIEVVGELRKKYPTIPVIVMSGGGRLPQGDYLRMVKIYGAHAVLPKPFSNATMLKAIADLLPPPPPKA
jgi:CheY-like chemotaxis protein